MQHPDVVATLLVHAGSPPSRLVIEQGDFESYFLELVGMKGGEGDE
jgi:ABC-2 type transport system ATP-binding protein